MRLKDALKEWDSLDMDEGMEPETTLVKAARRQEALHKAIDCKSHGGQMREMNEVNPNKKMRRFLVQFMPTVHDDIKDTAATLGLSVPELVRIAVGHWSVCEDGEAAFRKMLIGRLSESVPDPHK